MANRNSIDEIKPIINIPILILHECPMTAEVDEISTEYLDAITLFHKERAQAYFSKQVTALEGVFKYGEVKFHLILFPVPEKEPIVEKFVADVGHFKG